jgi:N-acetylmuramoyl-L-alanine amidase
LDAGHGLSNTRPGRFDPGAVSCYGGEHEIVSRVADLVVDHYANAAVSVVETPSCSDACLKKHPASSHLGFKIKFINRNAKRSPSGRTVGEVCISLHMNSGPEAASGTEVLYSAAAGAKRRAFAAKLSAAVAGTLGTTDRGPLSDTDTPRGSIAILSRTDCPAYLIELGFITNEADVIKVRECGKDAVIAAIEAIIKENSK